MDGVGLDEILEESNAESVCVVIDEYDLLAIVAVEPERSTLGAGMAFLHLEDAVVERSKAELLDCLEELRFAEFSIAPEADETGMPCAFLEHLTVIMLPHDVAVVVLDVRVVNELFAG